MLYLTCETQTEKWDSKGKRSLMPSMRLVLRVCVQQSAIYSAYNLISLLNNFEAGILHISFKFVSLLFLFHKIFFLSSFSMLLTLNLDWVEGWVGLKERKGTLLVSLKQSYYIDSS